MSAKPRLPSEVEAGQNHFFPSERTLSELPRSEPHCLLYALDNSRTLQSLLVAS